MNKKIIALAVASAFAAPMAAQAEIKVYGQAQVEYASFGGTGNDGVAVIDNARGRLGFKSSEDLGNGLKALAKFEFKTDTADGNSSGGAALTKRELMVGLKGGFGEFQAGRLKTAYKYTGGVKYDPFVATVLEARGNYGMTGKIGAGSLNNAAGHNGFVDDSIAYKNKFGNLHFWLTYDLDDGGANSQLDPNNNAGLSVGGIGAGGNALTASLKFKQKNWELFVAMVDDDADGAPVTSYSSTKVGGQWKGGAHKVSVQYEMADVYGAFDNDVLYVDYQLKFGKNILDVAYGISDYSGVGISVDGTFTRIALKHKFSKKTSAWVGFRETDATDVVGADADVISLGMRVDF